MNATMTAAYLPGNSTVELRTVPVPAPGHGEVLLRVKASTICGSDIRCIYHEHLGKGPGRLPGSDCGPRAVRADRGRGRGLPSVGVGDRVIVYHISGCGVCNDCRRGYMISCTSEKYRRAYGWQRDGGMAEYMIAEEKDLIALPDELSFADGAQVACGFGTVYEGSDKDRDQRQSCSSYHGAGSGGTGDGRALPQAGSEQNHRHRRGSGAYENCARSRAVRRGAGIGTGKRCPGEGTDRRPRSGARGGLLGASRGAGNCDRATRKWGRIVLIGEGGTVEMNPSPDMIHDQKTLYGSWVTSTWLMEELVERLVRWNLHPAEIITHRFPLQRAGEAYALMASGKCGKVAVCADEELR